MNSVPVKVTLVVNGVEEAHMVYVKPRTAHWSRRRALRRVIERFMRTYSGNGFEGMTVEFVTQPPPPSSGAGWYQDMLAGALPTADQ